MPPATAGRTGVVIVGASRTPLCSLGGQLSSLSAGALGGAAIAGALAQGGVPASAVDACHMGHVLTAGAGQAPARQAATAGGLGERVVCTSVSKACASGLTAIVLGCMEIQLGVRQAVVAGGMESMSSCPFYVREARFGARLGDRVLVDGLVSDGLTEPGVGCHMGMHAELCAQTYGFSRKDQDAFAAESYARGIASRDAGNFDWEVTPIPVPSKAGGAPGLVTRDEELSRTPISSLAGQRPAFKKDPADPGTVTAGNASPLSDGAAAAVLMSAGRAAALGVQPLAEILGYGDAETAPERFTIAPSLSLPVALRRAGVAIEDVDLFEVNEAFSVVALANAKLLGLDLARVNVHGGAVSLGHPLGCSGARIVVTLVNALRMRGGGVGAAAVCNGGGGSSAIVLRVHPPSET